MGEEEDFAYNVAQLALNSKIIFTVQDNITTTTITSEEEYEQQEIIEKEAPIKVLYNGEAYSKVAKATEETKPVPYKTKTSIKTENCNTNVDITYADTWIVEYINTYSNTVPQNGPNPGGGYPVTIEPTKNLVEEGTLETDEQISTELENFQISICGSEEKYLEEKEEKHIRGSIGDIFYKKYSTNINHTTMSKVEITQNSFVQETPTITEKTEGFTKLFNNSKKAKTNILTNRILMFNILEKGPRTTEMVDLLKYLFYKATGRNYGVKSLNLSIISLKEAKKVRGSSTENFIKAWENGPLWKYENDASAPFPTGYLTSDGLNYIVYEDGSRGHNNIAYGWATFITDSNRVEVNHPEYGGGYYNHKETFASEGIIVEDLYTGALVDRAAATAAFENTILPGFKRFVEDYLKDYLPEYEFSRPQKDALISIAYQRGNIFGFDEAYKNSLNEDGSIDPQKIKEKFIVNGEHVFSNIKAVNDREYANWLLFTQEIYIDRSGSEMITRINLDDWDGDYYVGDKYTFPVYNQYDSRWAKNPYGGPNGLPSIAGNGGKQKTISSSGCGCCSLAVALSGYLGELITPDKLTQKLNEVYPYGNYYSPGQGSNGFFCYDNKFLKEFGCSGKQIKTKDEALEALKNGYAVIGGEYGHYLTYVPVSSEDAEYGYVFRIIDSARGHNVLCRDFRDADLVVDGDAVVVSIIYPYTD